MKKGLLITSMLLVLLPAVALAVGPSNGNGNGASANSNSTVSTGSSTSSTVSTTSSTAAQSQTGTRTQTQAGNPGIGSMTREQALERVESQVTDSKPAYTPANSKALEHRSVVANAAELLIRTASRLENQGIGDQIRLVAQTQTKNEDKIYRERGQKHSF